MSVRKSWNHILEPVLWVMPPNGMSALCYLMYWVSPSKAKSGPGNPQALLHMYLRPILLTPGVSDPSGDSKGGWRVHTSFLKAGQEFRQHQGHL